MITGALAAGYVDPVHIYDNSNFTGEIDSQWLRFDELAWDIQAEGKLELSNDSPGVPKLNTTLYSATAYVKGNFTYTKGDGFVINRINVGLGRHVWRVWRGAPRACILQRAGPPFRPDSLTRTFFPSSFVILSSTCLSS